MFACSSQEGQYEREGYGQRPYDNWETIMFDCENQVGNCSGGDPEARPACIGSCKTSKALLVGLLYLQGYGKSLLLKLQPDGNGQHCLGPLRVH